MSHDPFAFVAIPVAQADVGDKMMVAMGFAQPGGQSFNVALSPTGAAPATHRAWWQAVLPAHVALLTASSPPAADWSAQGLSPAEAAAAWALRSVSIAEPDEGWSHRAWIDGRLLDLELLRVVVE